MENSKDVLKTGRNITGDRLYSAIDTMEELKQHMLKQQQNNICRNSNVK